MTQFALRLRGSIIILYKFNNYTLYTKHLEKINTEMFKKLIKHLYNTILTNIT